MTVDSGQFTLWGCVRPGIIDTAFAQRHTRNEATKRTQPHSLVLLDGATAGLAVWMLHPAAAHAERRA